MLTVFADRNALMMKTAKILDQEHGTFGLEYDNTQGKRNTMRLDAETYEEAIEEAKSFLSIDEKDQDEHGTPWEIQ